ncbi:hypothetical protein TCON_1140 [Astathelohania contejeani]|uniref:Uncharacterized protein n=1 Tax=Astathelohania contejeani TaxID=164912 RepID=A0ABQ7HZS0_9MICR|nr:hypothetical protein TCON_1140 [Thelohania contejeani]
MYDEIIPSTFDIEEHYNDKLPSGMALDSNTKFYLSNTSELPKKAGKVRKIYRVNRTNLKYDLFREVNEMHKRYLNELLGSKSPNAILPLIYKAELTGAEIKIKIGESYKIGIVVEERENCLVVIHENNDIKIYPKRSFDFIMAYNGIEYLFLARNLKKIRFLRK